MNRKRSAPDRTFPFDELIVVDVKNKMDLGSVRSLAQLTGRTPEDIYDSVRLSGAFEGFACELRNPMPTDFKPPSVTLPQRPQQPDLE